MSESISQISEQTRALSEADISIQTDEQQDIDQIQ